MNDFAKKWCRIAFVNLLLVATVGVLLRVKTIFSLPWLNYKFSLHAHSHFAFSGWVSLFLMAAMVGSLPAQQAGKYQRVFILSNLAAYGMLLSFPFQGYGLVSIIFSTASVFLSWWFAILFWKDTNAWGKSKLANLMAQWSLIFLVLSSFGTFFLAGLMAQKVNSPDLYFGAVYFYLHFQYNGWFFFAILSLFLQQIPKAVQDQMRPALQVLAIVTLPAWILSALWMRLPSWMYLTGAVAAVVQLLVFGRIFLNLWRIRHTHKSIAAVKLLWSLSLAAVTIKFLLQTGSIFPALNQYAFAYRPVVIGYLHLVLLGFVSLFNIGWMMDHDMFHLPDGLLPRSTWLFIAGFIITELTLMAQGITAMFFVHIPYTNECLLFAACCLFAGIGWMNTNVWFRHRLPAAPSIRQSGV